VSASAVADPTITLATGRDDDDLAQRCSDAGWTFTQRPDGELVVDLDVPDGFFQASVARHGGAQTCVSVTLTSGVEFPAPECEAAFWVLLLRIGGAVRMARAVTQATGGGVAAGFEVRFASAPVAGELGHALSALSIACRAGGREAAVVATNPQLACEYLRRSPWRLVPGP
jgi:hypothetical protein